MTYLRNFAGVSGAVFVLVLSVTTTAYVSAVYVPGELWVSRATPDLLGGGLVAVTTKSWLALKAYVASGEHEVNAASAVVPGKRILAFAVYGRLLWIASKWTLATLSQKSPETARAGMTVSASVVIVSRLAYAWYASRPRPDDERMADVSESDDRAASQGQSEPAAKRDLFFPSLPSVPDGEPRETMAPVRASTLAAGVGNAMTTGGVVDNRFGHWRQFTIRVGLANMMIVAVLTLFDGAVVVSSALATTALDLIGALSAVSAVHMLWALGGVEYNFHEFEVVAYHRFLGRRVSEGTKIVNRVRSGSRSRRRTAQIP